MVPCTQVLGQIQVGCNVIALLRNSSTSLIRTDVATHDVADLYSFHDNTGILERHKQLLSEPFREGQVRVPSLRIFLLKYLF